MSISLLSEDPTIKKSPSEVSTESYDLSLFVPPKYFLHKIFPSKSIL